MNFLKRTGISLLYYKKNTLLLLFIFMILGVIIQSGLSIFSVSLKSTAQVKKNITANILVMNDYSTTGDIYYGRNRISLKTIDKIARLPDVLSYNMIGFSLAKATNGLTPYYTENQADIIPLPNQFRIQGCNDIYSLKEFSSGDDELIYGRNIVPEDKNAAIICLDVSIQNDISLGDSIKLNSYYNDESVELSIIGIYKSNSAFPRTKYVVENAENLIITNIETVFLLNQLENVYSANFKISNPSKVEEFIQNIMSLSLNEKDDISFLIDTGTYHSVASTIDHIMDISLVMVISSVLMGMIVLTLLVMLLFKDRYYEIGILLSLGESKIKIILQMILEILSPILIGATGAVFISVYIAQRITDYLGGSENIIVSIQAIPVLLMYFFSILLTLIASISTIIKISYYNPREMLLNI